MARKMTLDEAYYRLPTVPYQRYTHARVLETYPYATDFRTLLPYPVFST